MRLHDPLGVRPSLEKSEVGKGERSQPGLGLSYSHFSPGRNYIPPSPPPMFWPEAIFKGEGGSVYFEPPPAAGILYPPLLIRPPLLEGYFQRWRGGGA